MKCDIDGCIFLIDEWCSPAEMYEHMDEHYTDMEDFHKEQAKHMTDEILDLKVMVKERDDTIEYMNELI